jgi:hypothetical protein
VSPPEIDAWHEALVAADIAPAEGVAGVACWRRLRDWQQAGVWDRLHRGLLNRLHEAERIDWSRACIDSASIAARRGGRNDRPKPNRLGPTNVNDSIPFEPMLDAVAPVADKRGRPRRRPDQVHARTSLKSNGARGGIRLTI